MAGGEKISENIGIGGGERERESKDYAASCGRLAMWEIFVSPRFVRAGVRVPQR